MGAEGTDFGRYKLIAVLGQGGMGQVYRAYDTVTERVMAVKVLPLHSADDPVFRERFRRESHAAAALQEPHIIPIYDYGDVNGRLFIATAVWVGTETGGPALDSLGGSIWGSTIPSDIWKATMDGALTGTEIERFPAPAPIDGVAGIPPS